MAFTERLTAPAADDRHWIQTAYGGLNECIHIGGGSVLPNCVGYAWGRVYEITGKRPSLSKNNAENWWGYTTDGYARGSAPKVGAVMCWAKGKAGVSSDGAGHVMVVERVNADGSVLASGSDYSGRRFYTRTFPSGYYLGSAYTFQGFIYASGEVSKYIDMEPVARDTAKDQITITSDVVNGRIYPGTVSRSWGFLKAGTYDLHLDLGVEEKDGYKWYCVNPDYNGIGDRVWVAYSPDWAQLFFTDAQPGTEEKINTILLIGPVSAGDQQTILEVACGLGLSTANLELEADETNNAEMLKSLYQDNQKLKEENTQFRQTIQRGLELMSEGEELFSEIQQRLG